MTERRGPRGNIGLPKGFLGRIRRAADFTQLELARQAETSPSTIFRAEQIDETSVDLAIALGVVFSNHFGFQIDLREKPEVQRIDEQLRQQSIPKSPVSDSEKSTSGKTETSTTQQPNKTCFARQTVEQGAQILSPGLNEDRAVIGRDADVEGICKLMLDDLEQKESRWIVLKGQGGVGKSTLGRFFVRRYADEFDGVWWLRTENEHTLVSDLCELAQVVGLADRGNGPEALARSVLVFLQTDPRRWLLVYDNATNYEMIRRWVPTSNTVHILATSREGNWPQNCVVLEVELLNFADAMRLLLETSNRNEDEGAKELSKALDGLPLAIVTAGSWLRSTKSTTFENYLAQLEARIRDAPPLANGYPHSVFGSLSLSFESLSQTANLLMAYISFLSPDHISPELFFNLVGKDRDCSRYSAVHDLIWDSGKSPAIVEAALSELTDKSLIAQQSGAYRVHRLTQSVYKMRLEYPQEAWNSAAALLSTSYPGKEPDGRTGMLVADSQTWPQCRVLNPHVENLYLNRFEARDSVPFEFLLNQASIYLGYNRQSKQALRYSIEYLRRKKARLPHSDIDIGIGYHNLSYRFTPLKRTIWAEKCARRAVAIMRMNDYVSEVRRIRWLSNLGYRIRNLAEEKAGLEKLTLLSEARSILHEAMAIFRSSKDESNLALRLTTNNLGLVHESMGRYGAARRMFSIALHYSAGRPLECATRAGNLGRVLVKAHHYLEALKHLGSAMKYKENIYRLNYKHPVLVASALWFATAKMLLKDESGVEEVLRKYGESIDRKMVEERALSVVDEANPATENRTADQVQS